MTLPLIAQLASSDCEAIHGGIVAQPANTVSSLAYLAAGLLLVLRAMRHRSDDAGVQVTYALALGSVGVGSVAFHGPMPSGALLLHDASIVAVFAVVTGHALGTMRRWSQAARIAVAALLTLADAVLLETWRAMGLAIAAAIALGGVGLEIHLHRSGRRPAAIRDVRLFAAAIGLLIVAGIINVLGRTAAPLCDPESLLQGHAVWHVLTAAAFGVYGLIAFPRRARQPATRR